MAMLLELRIAGGARDGERATFDQETVLVGRDASADLRLDPLLDRDVSTRHAELRRRDGRWSVRDLNSTNGTYVNGARIHGEARLRRGDRIGCGAGGPVLVVESLDELVDDGHHTIARPVPAAHAGAPAAPAAPAAAPGPAPRPSAAHRAARQHRRWLLATAAGVLLVGGGAYVVAQRRAAAQLAQVDAVLQRADSIRLAAERNAELLSGRLAGLDSALAAERQRTGELLGSLRSARDGGRAPAPATVARALDEAARRQAQLATLAGFDYAGVAAANQRAVALIVVEAASGEVQSGTAFGVTRDGMLVTNRHVVEERPDAPPRRMVVKYADTDEWIPARLVRADDAGDLALVQVEGGRDFPVVRGIAAAGTAPAVGNPVALIGYPLGFDTPMDGPASDFIARTSLFAGMVSKNTADVLQIDAYAGHGSSGSPVFDRRGAVVGVVYGGARESGGRIVYAVPAARLLALLPDGLVPRVR
ncbi:MAG TPA: trypsin-like peptidase domain-containing protein [Gemmatimonadaceae bacterium]|nr:trypsin-like peptidase domain-containing protein [Gemmatimonadaceae bacterium]